MLVTPTGLRTAPDTEPIQQPSSAAPSAEVAPAEVLITTQQVLFDTAVVVQRTRRAPLGSRMATALRRMAANANQPRHPYLRHYAYLEDARMAREMERL